MLYSYGTVTLRLCYSCVSVTFRLLLGLHAAHLRRIRPGVTAAARLVTNGYDCEFLFRLRRYVTGIWWLHDYYSTAVLQLRYGFVTAVLRLRCGFVRLLCNIVGCLVSSNLIGL